MSTISLLKLMVLLFKEQLFQLPYLINWIILLNGLGSQLFEMFRLLNGWEIWRQEIEVLQKQSQFVNRISYKGHSYELKLYTAQGLLKKFFLGTARLRVDRHGFSVSQLAYKRLDSRSYQNWFICNHLTNCSVIKRFSVKQISRLLLTLIFLLKNVISAIFDYK